MVRRPNADREDEEIPGYQLVFSDDFSDEVLDARRWLPHHLPHWSSRTLSRASYRLSGGSLILFIGEDQGPWCPEFDGEVKVSALQTGQFSGGRGSGIGQHRFSDKVRVREEQPVARLYTPLYGRIAMRARARMAADSLASLYLIGFEDAPENSGEITLMEIFGHNIHADGVIVGHGIKSINDERLETEFIEKKLPIRVDDWHNYTLEWDKSGISFYVDSELISVTKQSPDYAMQIMLTFYQIPSQEIASTGLDIGFEIDYVRGYTKCNN